ncbi:unnamed protein product [Dibothriocephalus latus]|uniref:Succinate dehydrogenase assembly factor 4, mitochondrial n=1 Tax=Dibothriocephalus latus TaxID=60516 RepID=A0A3P6V0Y4_DIBLA|nr:unnamed protein product [Dibothriocephalus latus]
MQRLVRGSTFITTQILKKPPKVASTKLYFSTCNKVEDEMKKKLKVNPMAEKEPLERFPNDINPRTGERGGPRGPEPTRYGDWERKGRCIDF